MDLNPLHDIRPITDFRNQAADIISQVRKTKRSILITQRGKSAAVLVDVEEYQKQLDKTELLMAILEGKEDIKRGRVRSHEDVMKDLDSWIK